MKIEYIYLIILIEKFELSKYYDLCAAASKRGLQVLV